MLRLRLAAAKARNADNVFHVPATESVTSRAGEIHVCSFDALRLWIGWDYPEHCIGSAECSLHDSGIAVRALHAIDPLENVGRKLALVAHDDADRLVRGKQMS